MFAEPFDPKTRGHRSTSLPSSAHWPGCAASDRASVEPLFYR
jgi:hypothetical protein